MARCLPRAPSRPLSTPHHGLIRSLRDAGQFEQSITAALALTALTPDDPLAHVKRRNDEGMRPGGYGVLVAKHLVDELIYGEKGNEVLLVKYLPGYEANKV